MLTTKSSSRLTLGMALIAGTAVLAGCGPSPVTRSTTTTEQITTTPPPMAAPVQSTTTTTINRP